MLFDLGYQGHQARFSRPGYRGTSLQDFHRRFPDEAACLRHVFEARFGADPVCPSCGVPARWCLVRNRRIFIHRRCRTRIGATSHTLMHHARVPPLLWFYVMLHLANSAESTNAGFLGRHLGIDTGSAQRMLLNIRTHLAALDFQPVIGAADDDIYLRIERFRGVYYPSSPRHNIGHVLFIASPSRLASIVIDPRRAWRLRGLIAGRIHRGARIWTDCYQSFRVIARYNEDRPCQVSFAPTYFADRPLLSDAVQAFASSFRHGFRTQHQHVQGNFLWLYLSEYLFRFNRRWRSEEIFSDMVAHFPALDPDARRLLTASHCDLPD